MTKELSKALSEAVDEEIYVEEAFEPFALTQNFGKAEKVDWWGGNFSCGEGDCDCCLDECEDVDGLDLE